MKIEYINPFIESVFGLGYPQDATWLDVPFDSSLGAFSMRVTLDLQVSWKGKAA